MVVGVSKARIEQALDGEDLPDDLRCADCGVALSEGSPITVLARLDEEGGRWRIESAWDISCAEYELAKTGVEIGGPTALVEGEVAAIADIAGQTHWPVLIRAAVVDHARVGRVKA